MTAWPNESDVWRMDYRWTVFPKHTITDSPKPYTFTMYAEMYIDQSWEHHNTTTRAKSSLKVKAPLWGTEAHENWYLLHYDEEHEIVMIHICAFTELVDTYDALTLVIRKDRLGQPRQEMSDEVASEIKEIAVEKLGTKFGKLVRIPKCDIDMD